MAINKTVSDSYYHFTGWTQNDHSDSFEKIKHIIRMKSFKLNPNSRKWLIKQGYRKDTSIAFNNFIVKMVCFTETPIYFLKDIIQKKGGFCLGMKEDWLLKNGGQNVIYVDNENPNDYGRALTEMLSLYNSTEVEINDSQELKKKRSSLIGALIAATEDIQYHEEREWRIIRNDLNESMADDFLPFEYSDINNIWCIDTYFEKLKNSIKDYNEVEQVDSLIRPISAL